MDLTKILSVSGKGGLFKLIAQSKNAMIVESFIDKKRFPVYSSGEASVLEDIRVFTNDKDLPLKDIFMKIYEKEVGKPAIDFKSDDAALKKYFEEILPDYDKERVFVSDIKKMLRWYNILLEAGIVKPEEEKKDGEAPAGESIQASDETEDGTKKERPELKTQPKKVPVKIAEPKVKGAPTSKAKSSANLNIAKKVGP